jgi:hypothetical protein
MGKPTGLSHAVVAVAALSSSTALAQPAPTSPDIVVEGIVRDDQRRVCKQTTATGSIIPTRTCKTKAEWEQIRERNLAQADQLKRDADRYRHTQALRDAICSDPSTPC